jgi:hypothetical protein
LRWFSSMSSGRPTKGNARCWQAMRSQTLQAHADRRRRCRICQVQALRVHQPAGVLAISARDVVSTEEAVSKIKAAADARQDSDLLILARTDACAVHGFEAAIERAQKFTEAGADILFVEAVTTADEIRALPRRLAQPQLMKMVIGGKTPIFGAEEGKPQWDALERKYS